MTVSDTRPIVLITGATGNLGRSLGKALGRDYRIAGLDLKAQGTEFPVFEADFTSEPSVELAMRKFRDAFGSRIASVIHLVAYFDFTGEEKPLYETVNVDGTRHLLRALQDFEVEQFIYASTMLVHAPCRPGEHIDEQQPIEPRWAYPKSKAAAEAMVRTEHKAIPYVILRLAGVYDSHSMVPTLARQIARIYDRDFESYFYSGSTLVGQAMLHRDDMLDAFHRSVDRRAALPPETEILIGEADAIGYDALQDELGYLIHGVDDWPTLRVPKPIAAVGAWAQGKLEPVIPDVIDGGEVPFIKPFMVAMADDHYALDIRRARELLGWEPQHHLKGELPKLVAVLKSDPSAWYQSNGISPPAWLGDADDVGKNPEKLRARHEAQIKVEHGANRWAHFVNMGLGTWLITQPLLINVTEPLLRWSEIVLGSLLIVCAGMALSWRASSARWLCAGIGALVMGLPFLFATGNAAAYLSDTLVGALIFGFAVCTKPEPGVSAIAALTGPEVPPGWSYNPSTWPQRLPIILLAILGLYVSRYLAAYQLGYIPDVWDPFFSGSPTDPQNGTEEIITSWVSEAWPVSDAAVGGYTYLLEILTGIVGSRMRWRTMPWLVILFGLMIAPLGITSIFFIVIQPVVIGTWSIVALIGAAAVLIQIPYSLDELIATLQFLRRRAKAGKNWLRIFFVGDTDEVPKTRSVQTNTDEFDQSPGIIIKNMMGGGVSLPWNLALTALIGLSLLFTRITLEVDGNMAHAHHVIGSLVLTVVSIAAAEVARPVRYLNILLGAALMAAPFMFAASITATIVSLVLGLSLIALSMRRGLIRERYGNWDRWII
ncbi:MAG: NAD-dependent epimerase/dehydratase family protein [Candidatus Nitrotoga sp.]|nr:NAD-dependent epimerase/dehydratase family protein [Candidatus Nitrotoga sp.]MDO9446948.1 NAD-dependent epimerase/dehydratase family protein [Candidatus Nitrotoga sp.]MDP3497833.1 NAD-dependent epimerase/dehydratase family protein [Candidatus Nitrotoga sp.]